MLGRTWRWIGEQFAFLIVLLGVAVGFLSLLVDPDRWRIGVGIIAVFVVLASLFRLFLPTARAGLLAVRGRGVDAVLYLLVGGLILAVDIRLRT